jgi:hypothetical protein
VSEQLEYVRRHTSPEEQAYRRGCHQLARLLVDMCITNRQPYLHLDQLVRVEAILLELRHDGADHPDLLRELSARLLGQERICEEGGRG